MVPVHTSHESSRERGIALVSAVLVVLLSSIIVATFMTTTVGERSMSSNVQIAKASLYAADAGVRTQQQALANMVKAKMDSCVLAWNGTDSLIIKNPGSLFPTGVFYQASTNPPFAASGTIAWADTDITKQMQAYDFKFSIVSQGSINNSGTRRVQADGNLRISATRGSFADYLIFLENHTTTSGSAIWFTSSVTFDGRVHANDRMHFAFKPNFYDAVSSTDHYAMFNNNGSPKTLAASNNGTIDVPNFYNGFYRDEANIPLPTNAYNQQQEALGNAGATTAPTNSAVNTVLGTGAGTGTPPNGIYVVNSAGSVAGGIYIQGSLNQCKMWADTVGNRQWYQLTQGSTVRTICVDPLAGTTNIWNGTNTGVTPLNSYLGVPNGQLFVNGAISDLRGPDRSGSGTVLPAIAEGNKTLVTANNDITITRDITYDSYDKATNVLGIFTPNGAVHVGSGAPKDMNLDAFVMATDASDGQFTVDGYSSGSPRGMFNLRGGITETFYGPFFTFNPSTGKLLTGYGRNFRYDKRGLVPPCYPTTIRFNSNMPTARTLAWKEI
jgi:Tfp pilus assembly protein PilX